MSETAAIRVESLRKRYGALWAVDGVSFSVEPGEVFCLLGPNGAGKTTTIECMEGYRRPDEGQIRVLGLDPTTEEAALRHVVGVQLQEASLPPRLKVWEILQLFSVLYERAEVPWSLLERLGLEHKRDAFFDKLSGGQKQRLFVALALINEPRVVFLDEITTGLDPRARQDIWGLIRDIRSNGATVVLSTHFMEEAEALADRVGIMKNGRMVANDTPGELLRSLDAAGQISLRVDGAVDVELLRSVPGVRQVDAELEGYRAYGAGRGWIARFIAAVDAQGADVVDVHTERASLEDVYLAATEEEPTMVGVR
ncbi:MAG: ABC transporter ATP-binding protein [Gemmatimonadota bacterium]